MAYAPHLRFQMGGTLSSAGASGPWIEVWQCTINGIEDVTIDEDAWLAHFAPLVVAWWTNASNHNSASARLEWCKLNKIDAAGHYVDPTHPHTYMSPTTNPGGVNGTYPDFCSVAYSWRTSRLRGPGSNGRIYLPNAWAPDGTGASTIPVSEAAAAAAEARALLNILATVHTSGHFIPCIASNKDASNTAISGIRVGTTIDVQRRRKNKVPEIYSSLSFP